MSLVAKLSDGPLDLIGDVHGEFGALVRLMDLLGYKRDGRHPAGRRLVFVGDLVDRGCDSPAVIDLVAGMVIAGYAQAILGNHELNLLLGKRKEGNGWFFEPDHDSASGHFLGAPRAPTQQRLAWLEWLDTLPVVLERADLRVVHACWQNESVKQLRSTSGPVARAYRLFSETVDDQLARQGLLAQRQSELVEWGDRLANHSTPAPFLRAVAATDSVRQSAHPLKACTSGLEQPTAAPFYATGKWRMTERVAWWRDYEDVPAVVIGHYWRWPGSESDAAARSRGPNLFDGHSPFDWLGPRRNVMCIDWCAGLRWCERAAGITSHVGRVGALRWPEREVVLAS